MNSTGSRVIAIACAYKDTSNVLKVLSVFPDNVVSEFCIMVDGATQFEANIIKRAALKIKTPVKVISHENRKGVGSAIREGVNYAIENNYEIAVVFAGNNKDDPREMSRLISPLLNGEYDYVQGSRFLPGGKAVRNPLLRGVFSRTYPFIWTMLTHVRCTEVTNGFRAYRLEIFSDKRININQSWLDEYELEYYLHYKVLTLGYRVKEVPVSKTYPRGHKGGYSKISPLKDWWKIIRPLVYLKLHLVD